MLTVNIICVGKIKEKFFADAISEYSKRISRYANIKIIELKDESTSNISSPAETAKVLEREGERILEKIPNSSYTIALCIEGKQQSSEELSETISNLSVSGISCINFIIGGSLGLSDSVKSRSDLKLSFSKMTFPHQLMQMILLEQIYRSFRIMNNEPYHK